MNLASRSPRESVLNTELTIPEIKVRSGWWWTYSSNEVEYCHLPFQVMSRQDGRTAGVDRPCGSWQCRSDAPARGQAEVDFLAPLFHRHRLIWVVEVPSGEAYRSRINRRADRAGADFYRTHRVERDYSNVVTTWVYTTNALSGRNEPRATDWVCLSPSEALEHLVTVGLLLPGVARVSASKRWKRPQDKYQPTGKYWGLGKWSGETVAEAKERIIEWQAFATWSAYVELVGAEVAKETLELTLRGGRD